MKAIVYHSEFPEKVSIQERQQPVDRDGECLVHIESAALNRRDQWIREGLYPGIQDDVVLGSDAYGEVVHGTDEWLGRKVIINPNINWGSNPSVQSGDYTILGMPNDGTLSEYLVVKADRLATSPSHLTAAEAAALPLAGLTAYRSCFTKAGVSKGDHVLITGIGGGVSQMALLFCLAVEAEVWVTSGSDDKIDFAGSRGAKGGFNYKNEEWTKEAASSGPFDAIIDSAGGALLNDYIKVVKPGGKIVLYGSTLGRTPKLDTARLFWSQAQIMGSSMGNDQEFQQMVKFVEDYEIVPTIDKVYHYTEYLSAFGRFKEPDHQGKIVLNF